MRKASLHLPILIAVFLFAGIAAKAQMPDFHISLFDEKDGIHASKIVDMVRDDRGFQSILNFDQLLEPGNLFCPPDRYYRTTLH